MIKKSVFIILFFLVSFCYAENPLPLEFNILPKISMSIDSYDVNTGPIDLHEEVWAPVSDANGFRVRINNNVAQVWNLSIRLQDDFGLVDSNPNVDSLENTIKAEDIKWALVYPEAGSPAVDNNHITALAANSKFAKGISFTKVSDGTGGTVISLDGSQTESYLYDLVFKFIFKPPVSTTAGTYSGTIVFNMETF